MSERICLNCGTQIERRNARGPAPDYCGQKCKREKNGRDAKRGAALITYALGWRIDRGSGEVAPKCFSEMQQMLDLWNAEDRKAGRPRADIPAAALLKKGRYIDRRRA